MFNDWNKTDLCVFESSGLSLRQQQKQTKEILNLGNKQSTKSL